MSGLLYRSSRRYLQRHPWQFLLSIVGVALGVAVVVAIDLANESSRAAFRLSTESVVGQTTHQVVGSSQGFSETIYRDIRLGLTAGHAAPVVEAHVTSPADSGRIFHLLGLDLFAEAPFRPYLRDVGLDGTNSLGPFMTQPNTVLLPQSLATRLNRTAGDSLAIWIGSRTVDLAILGVLSPEDDLQRAASQHLILGDIATVQEVTDQLGRLNRIDLILPNDTAAQQVATIEKRLPPGVTIQPASARANTVIQMTNAFQLNLTALSLLALIVGLFLIYNTMTFSIIQRRNLIGMLRAIGVTRAQIFRLILSEALVIGLLGSAIGLGLGILLATELVKLITQTINDLYFVMTVRDFTLAPFSLMKGLLLGIGGTVLTAIPPAREATAAPPRATFSQATLERRLRRAIPGTVFLGIVGLIMGGVILLSSGRSLLLSYGGLFIIVVSCALLTPAVTILLMAICRPLLGRGMGILGRMATRGVTSALSRTGIAIAALMIAISTTVGVGIMIDSFRGTVVRWLDSTLQADVYISPPTLMARRSDNAIDPRAVERIRQTSGVRQVSTHRGITLEMEGAPTEVVALGIERPMFDSFRFKQGAADEAWQAFRHQGAVIISEPYAYRHQLTLADRLALPTPDGVQTVPIAGIFYDYGSQQGVVMMHRQTYDRWWNDDTVTSLGVFAAANQPVEALVQRLQDNTREFELLIRSNKTLRTVSLTVFDRTFAITGVLRLLAIIVAFIGVLSALMALQLERAREIGVLRANGLTPRQVWGLVTTQTGLMGLVAGILSLPVGVILATIMIHVINKRSFGWSMEMQVTPTILLQALALAIIAAILAGLYPAYKMSRTPPAIALREE